MSQLAADLSSVVEDELRAFNFERLYAGEKAGSPEAIVQAARTLPMMGDRRVIVVLRAEKIFKPKRRGKGEDEEEADTGDAAADLDVLEAYVRSPETMTTVDIRRVRRRSGPPPLQGRPEERHDRRVLGPEARQGHQGARSAAGGQAGRGSGQAGRHGSGEADRSERIASGRGARRHRHRRSPGRSGATAFVHRGQGQDRSRGRAGRRDGGNIAGRLGRDQCHRAGRQRPAHCASSRLRSKAVAFPT